MSLFNKNRDDGRARPQSPGAELAAAASDGADPFDQSSVSTKDIVPPMDVTAPVKYGIDSIRGLRVTLSEVTVSLFMRLRILHKVHSLARERFPKDQHWVGLNHNMRHQPYSELDAMLDWINDKSPELFQTKEALESWRGLQSAWIYVHACLGDANAMRRMSRILGTYAEFGNGTTAQKAVHLMTAYGWQCIADCTDRLPPGSTAMRDAAFKWNDLTGLRAYCDQLVASTNELQAGGSVDPAPSQPKAPAAASAEPMSRPAGQTRKVLVAIGDPESNDGRAATFRFAKLLAPLPLVAPATGPDEVYATLRAEFPWAEEANVEAAQAVAISLQSSSGRFRLRPLLLLGEPGIGKTRWARRMSEIVGVPFRAIPFSGAGNSVVVTGVERGYSGARASMPANVLNDLACANPVVVGDEIDKVGDGRHNGNAAEAMVPLLERESACRYHDGYLMGELDLGDVTWILTANDLARIPQPLLTRLHVVRFGRPKPKDLDGLVAGILSELSREYGVGQDRLPDLAAARPRLGSALMSDGSVRALRGAVEAEIRGSFWSAPGPRLVASND
jgi:hypothetical protein